jgi:formylglycine-generating enzyme required for sulfatase activity
MMKKKIFIFVSLVFMVMSLAVAKMPSDEEYTNSIGMKFVRIKPGTFKMGVGKTPLPVELTHQRGTQPEGDFDETPNHTVEITKPFYVGIHEVTNYQYELFDSEHKKLRGKDEGLSKEDGEAVINVNWYEAQAYCEWLSDKEGLPYRLPTEAEWEYACRAGTTTPYHTGNTLPDSFRKNARMVGKAEPVPLHVGKISPNVWGIYDMHGNVEEWCNDWYGPYSKKRQVDPLGYVSGDFKVTRGGSHATDVYYLRSANRLGTVPEDKHWLIGFRVVIGEMPKTKPLPLPKAPLNQQNVVQRDKKLVSKGADRDKPYFKGPRQFVKIPKEAERGPLFAGHNHCPAIVECPNGDLLTIWYTGIGERERNMAIAASRLVYGEDQWQQASPFWDPPDRNDTALSLWFDGKDTVYHFNSLSVASNWAMMAVVMRTSTDSGATWSRSRLIIPDHWYGRQLSESVFRARDGSIVITVDGRDTLWMSKDEGLSWFNPGGDLPGNHCGVDQLEDGTIVGISRTKGKLNMPLSVSTDGGKTFTISDTEFPPVGGGQRAVLLRLKEGPLVMVGFGNIYGNTHFSPVFTTTSTGEKIQAKELFAAVSFDGGKTWPYKRIVAPDAPPQHIEHTDGGAIILSKRSSEHRGYLSICQGLDGIVHLISSRTHYSFNLKWLLTPPPPPDPEFRVRHEIETFDGPKNFDLQHWANYKAYKGSFNGKGQYTIDSSMPYGGLNRVIGAGSFEANFSIKNIKWHPDMRYRHTVIGFKDKFSFTWRLGFGRNGMEHGLSDNGSSC